jgi:hypothetical protein
MEDAVRGRPSKTCVLSTNDALNEEPVHHVQDDGAGIDEHIRCDSKTNIPGVVGPRYPQGHGDDPNLAKTCVLLVRQSCICDKW